MYENEDYSLLLKMFGVEEHSLLDGFKRDFLAFYKFLNYNGYWESMPASRKYHGCVKGGLRQHSLNVSLHAAKLISGLEGQPKSPVKMLWDHQSIKIDFDKLELIIAAYFHDMAKVGFVVDGTYSKEPYIIIPRYELGPKIDAISEPEYDIGKNYREADLWLNKTMLQPLNVYERLFDQLPSFNPMVREAILRHDGQYVPENKSYAHNETALALILHFADFFSAKSTGF